MLRGRVSERIPDLGTVCAPSEESHLDVPICHHLKAQWSLVPDPAAKGLLTVALTTELLQNTNLDFGVRTG